MTAGTFYLHAFSSTLVFQTIFVVAFRFSHEVDVLDVTTLMEYHSPIGIIVSQRRVDIEAIGQLCIDSYLVVRFQLVKGMGTDTAPLK